MSKKFQQPKLYENAFTCPFCNVYSQMNWSQAFPHNDLYTAQCSCCKNYSIWISRRREEVIPVLKHLQAKLDEVHPPPEPSMVYPLTSVVPVVNPDIPQEFAEIYNEAAKIFSLSPRGSAALLRLCLQKVCNFLTENKYEKINDSIIALQKTKFIPETLIQTAHTLRVMGNEAVHPGEIDFDDTPEIAYKLFGFINFFMDAILSHEKRIHEFFESQPPKIQGKIKQTASKQQEE